MLLHAAICGILLYPAVTHGTGAVTIAANSDAYRPMPPRLLHRNQVYSVALLRLRGGLRAETHEAETLPASKEIGQHEITSDLDGSAVTCLPSTAGRQEDAAVSGALKRVPTPMCLEMAAYDAFEKNQVVHCRGGTPRYAWDPKRRIWLLFKRADEDLSIESLRGRWDFPAEDCLTFRPRKPDKWQHVDWAPGLVGWVEFFFWTTPVLNQLLHLWRGLFPCAVCGLARSKHPCTSEREADAAFWQAVRFRDVELAVRLVRGGVECDPGGANWCLLAWLQANYCADAFSQLRNLDQDKAHEHLWKPGPRIRGWMGYSVPYI